MSKPACTRRLIALAAAYVIALQALLLPLAVAAANPLASAVCLSDDGTAPVGHEGACTAGCGMPSCGQALVDGRPLFLAATRLSVRLVSPPAAFVPVRLADLRNPQNPRAPPAA